MKKIHNIISEKFVIIIDEWDYILNNFSNNQEILKDNVTLIEMMFKGIQTTSYIRLAYLTDIFTNQIVTIYLHHITNFLSFLCLLHIHLKIELKKI